jgi:hypothetical protein
MNAFCDRNLSCEEKSSEDKQGTITVNPLTNYQFLMQNNVEKRRDNS